MTRNGQRTQDMQAIDARRGLWPSGGDVGALAEWEADAREEGVTRWRNGIGACAVAGIRAEFAYLPRTVGRAGESEGQLPNAARHNVDVGPFLAAVTPPAAR